MASAGGPPFAGRPPAWPGLLAAGTSRLHTRRNRNNAPPDQAPSPVHPEPGQSGSRILLAYFSSAGENYYYGGRTNLDVGNTEILAGMISALIPCEMHRIEAAEPYPDSYEATVARNVREQNQDARPAISEPPARHRRVRHRDPGQRHPERQGTNDHDHLRRKLRLHR